jgi:chromosomal replication initiation ATPase DnaA
MRQPRLFEFRMGERSPDTLVVTEANRDAARLLTDWKFWPGGALALIGPKGCGKTHLALAWALEAGAREIAPLAAPNDAASVFEEAQGRVLIDDADGPRDDGMLWRVLDLARARKGAVLLVGSSPPDKWDSGVPDLRSRLAALPIARLGEPDEALLEVVLRRICREQFIQLSDNASHYLAQRMPRTFAAAHALAAALDASIVKGAKPVSVAGAKRALELAEDSWGPNETG